MSTTFVTPALEFATSIGASYTVAIVETDPSLNKYFNCAGKDEDGVDGKGWLEFGLVLSGDLAETFFTADALDFAFGLTAIGGDGEVVSATTLSFAYALSADFSKLEAQAAWIYWSEIGSLDFDVTRSNVAGRMPIAHAGFVYDLRKLQQSVVAYCANGVVQMVPRENVWGQTRLSGLGSAGRFSQTGTDLQHWYVDRAGDLWQVSTEGLKKLGYSEYLGGLTSPVLTYDESNQLLYLCDGTTGYVYSTEYVCLAGGPPNITGVSVFSGETFTYAPEAVVVPAASFSTSVLDFGTRKEKTLFNIEIGADLDSAVTGYVSYRVDKAAAFVDTPEVTFTPRGIAYIPCYGIEFVLHLSVAEREDFTLDWFKVNGVIHGFSFLDTVRKER